MTEPENLTALMATVIGRLSTEVAQQEKHLEELHEQLDKANDALAQIVRVVDPGLWRDGQVNITDLIDRIESMQTDLAFKEGGV